MRATIFTIPNCPRCSAAKALLRRKHINFEEIDATTSAKCKWAYEQNPQFPVTDINGKRLEGFANLKEELK